MKPEGSLPCSHKPAIGPYPEPDECSSHSSTLFLKRIHFNIIFTLTRISHKRSLPFITKLLYIYFTQPRTFCLPRSSHPRLDHPTGETYKLQSSSLRSHLQSPATSSLLGTNVLFPCTLSLCLSLPISTPYCGHVPWG